MLSVPAPPALSAILTSAVPPRQPSDDQIPPIEVIPRRQDLNVVCKTSIARVARSPSLEIARKQSVVSTVSSSVEGEGQLARAAAYIHERIKRRSFVPDEFPCRSSKEPPDKPLNFASIEATSRCLKEDIISNKTEACK